MHPGPADAPAGVLACRNKLPAAAALPPGGTGRVGVQVGRAARGVVAVRAEADRAGTGQRNAGAAGAEVVQVRLDDPLQHHPAGSALRHRDPLLSPSPLRPWCVPGHAAVKSA